MKILLINPPKKYTIWAGIPEALNKGVFLYPPLGLMYLQSYLEENTRHQVILLDALADALDFSQIEAKVRQIKPQITGITASTHSLLDVVNTIAAARKAGDKTHICLGGPHVTSFPEESINLAGVDSVVLGDGELVFKELADSLEKKSSLRDVRGIIFKDEGGIFRTKEAQSIEDLDSLPFPKRERLTGLYRYYTSGTESNLMTTMVTSRGCPYGCSFCNTSKNYRYRSPSNVADEIEQCMGIGIKEFYFLDDTFNVTAKRVTDICEEVLSRELKIKWGFKARCDNIDYEMLRIAKKAGCRKIHYGVEAASDEALMRLNKGGQVNVKKIEQVFGWTRDLGMRSIAYAMIGCPYEKTREDVLRVSDFIKKINADYVVFSLFSPYPDTHSYQEAIKKGIIRKEAWEEFIKNPRQGCELPTCWEEYFSKKELLGLLKTVHRDFYIRWRIFLRSLFGLHSIGEFKRLCKDALALWRLFIIKEPGGKI